ncbi:class I SAM-dependent methyltransferase [Kaarinaea lacus]
MNDSNDFQQQKDNVAQVFNTVSTGYDNAALRFFPFCADHIVSTLKPRPGQKILDVATGTGAVAVALAQAIRPQGRVIAIDLAEGMLARAEHNVNKMALDNVDLFQMDAEQLDFKRDYFDASVCSFGLFFMPQMQRALNEWVRVTKPGGTVLFTSFTSNAFQPQREKMFTLLSEYGVDVSGNRFASDKLTDPDVCQNLMEQAGLKNIRVEKKQLGYHLNSAQDWWEVMWNSAGRRPLLQLDDEQRADFRIKHTAEIQQMATEKGVWMDVEVLFTSGIVS